MLITSHGHNEHLSMHCIHGQRQNNTQTIRKKANYALLYFFAAADATCKLIPCDIILKQPQSLITDD